MKIKRWEIYLVQFSPSIGHEYQKARPAVIISSDEFLEKSSLFACIAITSNNNNFLKQDDVLMKKTNVNNLTSDSVIKMHHISSFDKSRIIKYIGKLDFNLINKVKSKLKLQFDL